MCVRVYVSFMSRAGHLLDIVTVRLHAFYTRCIEFGLDSLFVLLTVLSNDYAAVTLMSCLSLRFSFVFLLCQWHYYPYLSDRELPPYLDPWRGTVEHLLSTGRMDEQTHTADAVVKAARQQAPHAAVWYASVIPYLCRGFKALTVRNVT